MATVTREKIFTLLKEYGLRVICTSTVNDWLLKLGFVYSVNRATYYVDSHERPDVIEDRRRFVNGYFDKEDRAHRWVQVPLGHFGARFLKDGEEYVF